MYFCEKQFYIKKVILSITVLAMVFVGCKKEETKPSDSSTSSSTSRISKETTYSYKDSIITDTSITLYTYDSKGRLVSEINDYFTSTYSYISANLISITKSLKNNSSIQNFKVNYILDSKGKVIKQYSEGTNDTTKVNYTKEGFPLPASSNIQIEVLNENIVKNVNTTNGNTIYEYYLDKINGLGYANHGVYFMGKDSKNLIKSVKWESPGTQKMRSSTQYTYEFDSKNRVIKSTENSVTTFDNSSSMDYDGKSITKYEYTN
jgi:hypothetical protein